MKRNLILTVLIAMSSALYAQFSPQVSYFMFDQLRTNPGSAGSSDMIDANGIYRNQMVGFKGSPTSFFFDINAPFKLLGAQHGVGINAYSDVLGFFNNTDFEVSYAYRFSLGNGTLGIGIQGGIISSKLNATWMYVNGDQVANDGSIPMGSGNKSKLNLAAGLFYRTEDIYFGISSVNINNPVIQTISSGSGTSSGSYTIARQYYITAGYTMQLTNPAYEVKPAILLKSDTKVTDMDINIILEYNKTIWGGVTYRTGEAVVGMAGLALTQLVPGLKVGFAYDFLTSSLNKKTESYEVLLNYSFKIGVEKTPQKYKSIRFL
jgi:type IX secretion system PorP/SprF family membrane protein